MQRIPVISKEGKPLMPTKCSKARKLVQKGKAIGKFDKLNQYYIQLTFTPSGENLQPISCGIDPGKLFGSVCIQSSKNTLFTSHIFLPFKIVKKRMEQRATLRRTRRGRRINRKSPYKQRSYRQCRFSNRKKSKLPPSIKANQQLLLRVVNELAKVYPITSIVYESCKAKGNKSFSPVMVGQRRILEQLSKIAPVVEKFGWQTSNLRDYLGLEKQKYSKGDITPATHAVDGVTLSSFEFMDYKSFENSKGRGHLWEGIVSITEAPFYVIRRPPISRRQLHLTVCAKGGKRRKYGGTVTRHGFRKGDLVVAERKGVEYVGWCSGDTQTQVSVSDSDWKRVGQFSKNKVRLLRRSTGLISKQLYGGMAFIPSLKAKVSCQN